MNWNQFEARKWGAAQKKCTNFNYIHNEMKLNFNLLSPPALSLVLFMSPLNRQLKIPQWKMQKKSV